MTMAGKFQFSFLDARGLRLNAQEQLTVTIQHSVLKSPESRITFSCRGDQTVVTPRALESTPAGHHFVTIESQHYHTRQSLTRIQPGQTVEHAFRLILRPDRVTPVNFPAYAALPATLQQLLDGDGTVAAGTKAYDKLPDLKKAALLNLHAKLRATKFADGETADLHLTALVRLEQDRMYAQAAGRYHVALIETLDKKQIEQVSSALHKAPAGFKEYERLAGYKTFDRAGNLNWSVFVAPAPAEDFLLDIDIDEARGLEHVFDVIRHGITGKKTHPYEIHQILWALQKIDPGYELSVV